MSLRASETEVFMAVSDPTRRAILDLLSRSDRSVGELAAQFDVTMSAVSQHMRVLREAGLVEVRKQGRHRVYRIAPDPIRHVHDWSAKYSAFWKDRVDALSGTLDRMRDEEEKDESTR
jgi:DNA-binding transcriptional ArsR family regulator